MATSMSGKPIYGTGLFDLTPALNTAGLKAIEAQLSQNLDKITGKVSKSWGEKLLVGPLQSAAKWGKRAGVVLGGIGATIGALAIKGGISRALDMETATVQLQRMGVAGDDLKKVLSDVSDAVDGTTFTTPDMFKFAQLMIGSNVELDKLGPILNTVADFAAHANVPLDRMGEVFVKIQAQGKVTARELMQLSTAGVALTPIAEALGMTTEEMRKLVSQGKLSADQFFEAAANVEMYKGAAQAAGDTTRGALANVFSQMKRLGEIVVSPLFGQGGPMVTLFKAVRQALIDLRPVAENAGAVVERVVVPAIQRLSDWVSDGGIARGIETLTGLWEKFTGVFYGAGGIADNIGNVFQAIRNAAADGTLFQLIVDNVRGLFASLIDWLGSTGIDMIVTTIVNSRTLILDAAMKLFPALVEAVQSAVPLVIQAISYFLTAQLPALFTDAVPLLLDTALELFTMLVDAIGEVIPVVVAAIANDLIPNLTQAIIVAVPAVLTAAQTLFTGVIQGLQTIIPVLLDALVQLLGQAGPAVSAILMMVPDILRAGITLFQTFVQALVEVLPQLVETLFGVVLPQLVATIVELLPAVLDAAIELFMALVQGILDVLPVLIETIVGVALPSVIATLLTLIPELLNAAITLFLALVDAIPVVIPQLIDIIVTVLIPTLIGALIGMIPDVLAAGVKAFVSLGTGIVQAIPSVVGAVGSVIGSIIGGVAKLPGAMLDAGKRAIGALGDGIKNAGKGVVDWVQNNVVQKIKNLWPFSPAKEGPFRGKGNPYFAGQNVMNLFAEGIRAATPNVLAAATVGLPPMTIPGHPADMLGMLGVGGLAVQSDIPAVAGTAGPLIGEVHVHNPIGEPTEESLQDPGLLSVIGSYVRGMP